MDYREELGRGPFSREKVRAVVWLDQLHTSYGLPCAGGDFSRCEHDLETCKERSGRYLNTQWDKCPVRVILDDPRLTAAMHLERCAKISPLSNWPERYSAWVPALIATLSKARADRINSDRGR